MLHIVSNKNIENINGIKHLCIFQVPYMRVHPTSNWVQSSGVWNRNGNHANSHLNYCCIWWTSYRINDKVLVDLKNWKCVHIKWLNLTDNTAQHIFALFSLFNELVDLCSPVWRIRCIIFCIFLLVGSSSVKLVWPITEKNILDLLISNLAGKLVITRRQPLLI